jgi:tRNA(Ile)-lysidine synthase
MAWSLAHAKLHTLLRQKILLPRNSPVLMAVSGGQDSLCLARLLMDLRMHWQWSLALIHCDHRWRADSAANADYLFNLAKNWDIPAWIEVASVIPGNEAEARKWRYETFSRVARMQGYSHVVTGHTASDRAETVLYNLIRGSSLDGISSLPWQRSLDGHLPAINLVRPLLDFSRQETHEFCQHQQIRVWEDSSNADLSFRRNRIRQELLPYLSEHFNPQVERSLCKIAEITAAEVAYLQQQASELYAQVVTEVIPEYDSENFDFENFDFENFDSENSDSENSVPCQPFWEIDARQLSQAPLALQRRVIRQLLHQTLPQAPNFHQIEALITLLTAPNGSQTSTYPGNFIARVHKPVVRFSKLSSTTP